MSNEKDYKKALLAAGKVALAARLIATSNVHNLSIRVERLVEALDAYDNEIMKLEK